MGKIRQHNIEGLLEIQLCYNELAEKEVEIFPDFIENPVYMPERFLVLFSREDAYVVLG